MLSVVHWCFYDFAIELLCSIKTILGLQRIEIVSVDSLYHVVEDEIKAICDVKINWTVSCFVSFYCPVYRGVLRFLL